MNKALIILKAVLLLAFASTLSSCKKNEASPDPYGKVEVSFANEVDGQPVAMGPMSYTNAAGNNYSISLLKYYISNVTLTRADGSEKHFSLYKLIDASDPTTTSLTLDSVANGNYTSVKFLLGIDADRNHTGAQDGDLDPAKGMIWTWNTGYIFFKHEGDYKDSNGVSQPLAMHYGTDLAGVTVILPLSGLEVSGNTKKLKLKFNLNKVYSTPTVIDFHGNAVRQSTSASDVPWIKQMKGNFPNAFSVDQIQ